MWCSCGALVVLTWLGLVPPAPGLVHLIRAYIFSVINLIDILCWATKCHKMPFSLSIIFIPFRGIFSKLFQHKLNRRDEDQRSTVIPIRDLQYQKIFGPSYVLRYCQMILNLDSKSVIFDWKSILIKLTKFDRKISCTDCSISVREPDMIVSCPSHCP